MEVKGGSRAAATSRMERFMIIDVDLDVAAALDPPLYSENFRISF